jgi:Protein of unknwon function (DUF3310)
MEAVNHPAHYGGADNEFETIKVIEGLGEGIGMGMSIGNALKYLSRAGKKDKEKVVEDLQKCIWYLKRLEKYQGSKIDLGEVSERYSSISNISDNWQLPIRLYLVLDMIFCFVKNREYDSIKKAIRLIEAEIVFINE